LGRCESRQSRSQVSCCVSKEWTSTVHRHEYGWSLSINPSCQDSANHARGTSYFGFHPRPLYWNSKILTTSQIVWDTTAFNNKADWPADGSQPFILSTGDSTGYSQHGDYVFGWKGDSLQRAMDGGPCTGASCAGLKELAMGAEKACKVPRLYPENADGCKFELHLS